MSDWLILAVAYGIALALGFFADTWLPALFTLGWSISEFRPRRCSR